MRTGFCIALVLLFTIPRTIGAERRFQRVDVLLPRSGELGELGEEFLKGFLLSLKGDFEVRIWETEANPRRTRTIVSDIALYNKDEIARGIKNDTLFDDLAEEIDRGRKLYNSRVVPELQDASNFFNQALVDVLVKPSGTIESDIW